MHVQTLNMIGCGRVGKTLAALWQRSVLLTTQAILNRSLDSGMNAAAFIGAGTGVAAYSALGASDITLVGTGDDHIAAACNALAVSGTLRRGSIVFHCSGALSASILNTARQAGAYVASVHPVASFAEPAQMMGNFPGTWCAFEGDAEALAILIPLFEAIGARAITIDGANKTLYHAAAVFASNYLVTLMDIAIRTYAAAGINEADSLALMQPLVENTVANIFRLGPAKALTGPMARGDNATVQRQHEALMQQDSLNAELYRQFAQQTALLAGRFSPI